MWILLFAWAASAAASDSSSVQAPLEIPLAPVEVRGTPADLLQDDPVVPAVERSTAGDRAEGAIHLEVGEALGLPVTDYGTPGGLGQFRGLGRSATEMDVQTLGVPLNLPQGLGFDFSVFPQFLWTGFRYRAVSAAASRDPRASGGSLTLIPWTYDALEAERAGLRVSQLYASEGLSQSSVAASTRGAAAVAGYSAGSARGPSGAIGAGTRLAGGKVRVQAHVLGTDIEADSPGPDKGPSYLKTPEAFQRTTRIIPFVQADAELSSRTLLKQAVFFDRSEYRYEDPESAFDPSEVRTSQWGADSALRHGDWRAGLAYRRVVYETADFSHPAEHIGRVELGRVIRSGGWTWDATASASGVSRFGIAPSVGAGIRRELGDTRSALFLRARFDRRVPTLSDRYFDVPYFRANPDLEPERVLGAVTGWERDGADWGGEVALEAQWVEDAMIVGTYSPSAMTVRNQGNAWRGALRAQARASILTWLRVRGAVSVAASRIEASGEPYPYLPRLAGSLGLEGDLGRTWEMDLTSRFSGSIPESSDSRLGGYSWFGFGVRGRLWTWGGQGGGLDLGARIENLADREIELVRNYVLPGRSFTVSLTGTY